MPHLVAEVQLQVGTTEQQYTFRIIVPIQTLVDQQFNGQLIGEMEVVTKPFQVILQQADQVVQDWLILFQQPQNQNKVLQHNLL